MAQLSVFRGSFMRGAAEQVAKTTLALLSALVDKSLLELVANDRYGLHMLIRLGVLLTHRACFAHCLGQGDLAQSLSTKRQIKRLGKRLSDGRFVNIPSMQ